MKLKRISLAAVVTLLLLPFQNCSPSAPKPSTAASSQVSVSSVDAESTSLNVSGTGHGYDGKLYVHLDRVRLCSDNTHMVSSILVRDDGSGLMDRKDCQFITPETVAAADLEFSTGSGDQLNYGGNQYVVDPCANRTQPQTGTVCGNGGVYAGTMVYEGLGRKHTMVTPGGCTNSTHPVCNGSTDSLALKWGASGTATGLLNTENGQANSAALAAFSDALAARYCENLVYAGFTDWYLPASDEFYILNQKRGRLPGLNASSSVRYWTSTEVSATNAWAQRIANSAISMPKANSHLVRCMRRY